jgi:Glycosyl hydrolase family 26
VRFPYTSRLGERPPRTSRHVVAHCAGVLGLGSALVAAAIPTLAVTPAGASGRIVVGASGDNSQLSRAIGVPLATHVFGKLAGRARIGTLTNIQSTTSWRQVAGAAAGSSVYQDMVRWADAVRATGHPVLVTFHHEPETRSSDRYGSNTDFIAAWRKIHDVFASRGARNAEWVWTLSANSFHVPASDQRYANRWYPGGSYVDYVGADPYNWVNCGQGRGGWRTLADILAPAMTWARAHHKGMVLAEFASNVDPHNSAHKAQWIADAHRYISQNRGTFRAVFYFNNVDGNRCHWKIDTPSEVSAFRSLASDGAFGSSL